MGGYLSTKLATAGGKAAIDAFEPFRSPAKEFSFTVTDFERVRALIHERAGIALGQGKQEMVYSRLSRRLRVLGLQSFDAYLTELQRYNDGPEWELFTNALTTNLTSFFREEHHFPVLAAHARGRCGPLKLWCNASSTGEEPYSIAMTLCEAFDSLHPPVSILATDIDTRVLAEAAQGVYAMDRIADLSEARCKRFFLRGKGDSSGKVRVRPELRELIDFQPLNLLAAQWAVQGPLDAIFCRNVMIYFDRPTQERLANRLGRALVPGGYLFTGRAESLNGLALPLRCLRPSIYQKPN